LKSLRKPRANTLDHDVPRCSDGRWAPGSSPNPSGRPRVVKDIRDLARQHSQAAIKTLVDIAENGKQEAARVSAASALLDRGYGRPTQPLAGDEDMGPIGVSITDREAEIAGKRAAAKAMLLEAFGTETENP
jgi:hypothetical protein